MDDQFYVKELDQHFPTRLDILLYAHDGRGLGHASRTIGIGMALKRLYPHLRILFVTGANISQSLMGNSTLDWVKLPSYASQIVDGISTGIDGPANFSKYVLAEHRKTMLAQIVSSFKPRCVLVDHSPLGKRKELLDAITVSKSFDTKWVLGLRAVIGTQEDFWSKELRDTYRQHYHSLLWYGDKKVIGSEHIERINNHFECHAIETGYVSRLYESKKLASNPHQDLTGTISIPWLSKDTHNFIKTLKETLELRNSNERWKVFIDKKELVSAQELFANISNCSIEPVGEKYTEAIFSSKIAIIYGGYNSLMDIYAAQTPTIVVERYMQDQEQELHIQQLLNFTPHFIARIDEQTNDSSRLNKIIDKQLRINKQRLEINIQGSTNSASFLNTLIEK